MHHLLLPVVSFLGEQLLELVEGDHATLDQGAVWNWLPAEVVCHNDVLAGLGAATARPLLWFCSRGANTKKALRSAIAGDNRSQGGLSRIGKPVFLLLITRQDCLS